MAVCTDHKGDEVTVSQRYYVIAVIFLFSACSSDEPAGSISTVDAGPDAVVSDSGVEPDAMDAGQTRSFHMGMTSWPYAATFEAVRRTKELVREHGDLYAICLDNGLPWDAAATDGPYPENVLNKLSELGAELPEDRQRFVSVGLLDLTRSVLATDWEGIPRSGEFENIGFGDPVVLEAYGNWLDLIIEMLAPDWFNFAIEVSELAHETPDEWGNAATLVCALYARLTERYPDLPVFFSVALKHPDSEVTEELMDALPMVAACTDFAAASSYGYVFHGHADAGHPENLPDIWLSQIETLIPDRPVVVAETAWPAEDLTIEMWNIATVSTPEFQQQYVDRLLTEAQRLDALLVVWWCAVDFDRLWEIALNSDPLASIWRDTGFYDPDVVPRPALASWTSWLGLAHVVPEVQ